MCAPFTPASVRERPGLRRRFDRSPVPFDVMSEREDRRTYKVVINHEEQYSIWPATRENPTGWNDTAKIGTLGDCKAYINEVWTDMRPRSLREEMDRP